MSGVLKKLKKLKGRSADELRVRGAQALAAAAERAGFSKLSRLPSDEAFLRTLNAQGIELRSAEAWLEHFRTRSAARFFKGFDDEAASGWSSSGSSPPVLASRYCRNATIAPGSRTSSAGRCWRLIRRAISRWSHG